MKTRYAILLNLFGGALLCQAQAAEWTTLIVQKDVATGAEYYLYPPATGSQISLAPLGAQGAIFQLWGLKGAAEAFSISEASTGTGEYKSNNGHGNNIDGVDSSNPGQGNGGPTGLNNTGQDPSAGFDDEQKLVTGDTSSTSTASASETTGTSSLPEKHLLDTQLVDVYQPSAQIQITTEDPYPLAPRTRADRPFTVQYTISGLLGTELGVDAASKVLLNHDVKSYSKPVFVDGNFLQSDSHFSGYLEGNGITATSHPASNLPTTDPLKGIGIEVFTIDALPDYQVPSTRLATATLEVYPVAIGKISGIKNGGVYESMPTISVDLHDLYPTSTTYIQIYPGERKLGTAGTILADSVVVVNDVTSQDKQVQINNWSFHVNVGGKWTMELITETPFGVEVMDAIEWDFDDVLEINGQIFSSEK